MGTSYSFPALRGTNRPALQRAASELIRTPVTRYSHILTEDYSSDESFDSEEETTAVVRVPDEKDFALVRAGGALVGNVLIPRTRPSPEDEDFEGEEYSSVSEGEVDVVELEGEVDVVGLEGEVDVVELEGEVDVAAVAEEVLVVKEGEGRETVEENEGVSEDERAEVGHGLWVSVDREEEEENGFMVEMEDGDSPIQNSDYLTTIASVFYGSSSTFASCIAIEETTEERTIFPDKPKSLVVTLHGVSSLLANQSIVLLTTNKQGNESIWYTFVGELDCQRGTRQLLALDSPTDGSSTKKYPFDIPTEEFPFEIFKLALDSVNSYVIGRTDGVEERFMIEMAKGYASYKEDFGHATFGHELAACAVQIYCPIEFSDSTSISTILDASNFASCIATEDSLDISLGKQLAADVAFSLHPKNLVVTLYILLPGNQSMALLLTTNKLYLLYEKQQGNESIRCTFIGELDCLQGRRQLFAQESAIDGSLAKKYSFDVPTEEFPFQIFKQTFDFVNSCVIGHTDGAEEMFMVERKEGYASYREGFGYTMIADELAAACAVQINGSGEHLEDEFSDLTLISTILDASSFASCIGIEDSLGISEETSTYLGKQLASDVAFSLHLKNLVVTFDRLLLGNQSIGKDGSDFVSSVHVEDAYETSPDQSPHDTIAAQVPYRFRIAQRLKNKNQMDHAVRVDMAEIKAVRLEENSKGCLDFSCTVLDTVYYPMSDVALFFLAMGGCLSI